MTTARQREVNDGKGIPGPGSVLSALLLFFLCSHAALAQNLNLRHYGIRDGLPQTQIRSIHQDHTGYLWVGSFGGLGRYDGRSFTVFSTRDGLSSNNITTIASTADGTLWAGTTGGACFLERGRETFECVQDPALTTAHITALLPAPDGLWVGTEYGLFRVDATRRVQRVDPGPAASPLEVTSLAAAPDGDIWIGTRSGLHRLADGAVIAAPSLPRNADAQIRVLLQDGPRLWIGAVSGLYVLEDDRVTPARDLPAGWTQDDVNALATDDNGTLWAATDQGILRRKDNTFRLFTTHDGLMTNIAFTIDVDREGVVWIGNDDGLSKHVPGPFAGYTEANGLLHYFVRTINEDALGRLWLGTRTGAQVVPHDGGEWQFERSITITADDGLLDERIYSIALPSAHEAYLATGNGVVHWREGRGIVDTITDDDGLPTNATQALRLQDNGRLWIGTNLGVRYLEDGEMHSPADPELAEAYVYKIEEDTRGRLWFGSQDQGLFLRGIDGSVTRFGIAQGLTDETIWDIARDAHGGVWVGSNGDGLYHIDADGTIARYTTADGLVDNFIWQVIVDDKGNTWTYTNRGISRFDGKRFHSYTEDDGLLHLEGGATGAWQTRDGQLWFASARGLMRYDPARERRNVRAPVVVIQNVLFGDAAVPDGATLPYRSDSLNIQYAALSFQNEDELRYRYRLLGADERWSEPVPYRPITYASLGAGDYVFEVSALNPDGVQSLAPARFRFRVASPYWASAWFWLAALFVIAAVLWAAYRLRIRRMEVRRRELEGLVTQRTQELEVANEQLKAASLIDPLTGLHNRRFLMSQIDTDLAQSRRAHRAPGVFPNRDVIFMMIDIDDFKEINDTYGHIAGDRVLRQYAHLLREQIRESDYVVRWGGEEFLIVARQAESTQSNVIAARILDAVRAAEFEIDDDGRTIQCTCSIGISHFPFLPEHANAFNWEQIVDIADIAVYVAKANGRNGWVAIHGTERPYEDSAAVARRFREDLKTHVDAGWLRVQSSFDADLEITLNDRRARRAR